MYMPFLTDIYNTRLKAYKLRLVEDLKLTASKKAAIKRNRESMAATKRDVKKSRRNPFDILEDKITVILCSIFALLTFGVVVKGVTTPKVEEKIPDNYYIFSHKYDSEVDDFSVPNKPVENEGDMEKQKNQKAQNSDTTVIDAKNLTPISCWGDSFTVAPNENSISYASVLADLSGRIVYNIGISGDSIKTIAGRQGGVLMYTTPFIIPSDKTPVEISVDSSYGGSRLDIDFEKNAGLNPCTIKGVQGMISKINDKLYFTRTNSGAEVMVYQPEPVITRAMELRRNDISVFFVGSDSMFDQPDKITEIYGKMVDYLQTDEFIIVGPVKGDTEVLSALEAKLEEKFGNKFLNIRKFLCEYSFNHDLEMDITLPSDEVKLAKAGVVPQTFIKNEQYLSDYGVFAVGEAVNEKLEALGYYKH